MHRDIASSRRQQRYCEEDGVLRDLAERGEQMYPDLEGFLGAEHPRLD